MTPFDLEALLSGRQRGAGASLVRGALRLCEIPYSLAVRWRNHRYDRASGNIHRIAAPVISVGNVTTGGTGKTPFVAWIAGWLCKQGVRVGLVSRGYGSRPGAANDEALELEHKLPDVPHIQNPDRYAAAQRALSEYFSQVIVLDDGFQHRRLHRDLDFVLLDALEPYGFGHLLPRGLMREPLAGLRRAHAIGLSRADLVDSTRRATIREAVAQLAPQSVWFELAHRPQHLVSATGSTIPVTQFASSPILAFCGIGNPRGFQQTLESCGYQLLDLRTYPDHYHYQPRDLESIAQWVRAHPSAVAVICTRKDLVKLAAESLERPLWALAIEAEFLSGLEQVEQLLAAVVARIPADSR